MRGDNKLAEKAAKRASERRKASKNLAPSRRRGAPKKRAPKLQERPSDLPPQTYAEAKALYNSEEYREWRQYVYSRDIFQCQLCGNVGVEIEAHHIRPKKKFPHLTLDKLNGITLCKHCHQQIVTGREERFYYIFERIAKMNTIALRRKLQGDK
jgi:5-methylcytosine-specific restriction endonuclease McrA